MTLSELTRPNGVEFGLALTTNGQVSIVRLVSSVSEILSKVFRTEPTIWYVPSESGTSTFIWSDEGKGHFYFTNNEMRLALDWSDDPHWDEFVADICSRLAVAVVDGNLSVVTSLSLKLVREFEGDSSFKEFCSRYINADRMELHRDSEVSLSWSQQLEDSCRRQASFRFSSEEKRLAVEYTRPGSDSMTAAGLEEIIAKWLDWGGVSEAVSW